MAKDRDSGTGFTEVGEHFRLLDLFTGVLVFAGVLVLTGGVLGLRDLLLLIPALVLWQLAAMYLWVWLVFWLAHFRFVRPYSGGDADVASDQKFFQAFLENWSSNRYVLAGLVVVFRTVICISAYRLIRPMLGTG